MSALAALMSTLVCLPAAVPPKPSTLAVLTVGAPGGPAARAAADLRARRPVAELLGAPAFHQRLVHGSANTCAPPLKGLETQVADAQRLLAASRIREAVTSLEGVITALEQDAQPDRPKATLLRSARVLAAEALLASSHEQGGARADSPEGKAARNHLRAVLRAAPFFALPAAEHPPSLRLALEMARQELQDEPKHTLLVTSDAAGVDVFVDGRHMGGAPATVEGLAAGTYHLWTELAGFSSPSVLVTVSAASREVQVHVPWAGDSALVTPCSARLQVDPADVDDALLASLAQKAGVDRVLVLVDHGRRKFHATRDPRGEYSGSWTEEPEVQGLLHDNLGGGVVRRATSEDGNSRALTTFLLDGTPGTGVRALDYPARFVDERVEFLPLEGNAPMGVRQQLGDALQAAWQQAGGVGSSSRQSTSLTWQLWERGLCGTPAPDLHKRVVAQVDPAAWRSGPDIPWERMDVLDGCFKAPLADLAARAPADFQWKHGWLARGTVVPSGEGHHVLLVLTSLSGASPPRLLRLDNVDPRSLPRLVARLRRHAAPHASGQLAFRAAFTGELRVDDLPVAGGPGAFLGNVMPGRHLVTVKPHGAAATSLTVEAMPGQRTNVTLRLDHGAHVTAQATHEDWHPDAP